MRVRQDRGAVVHRADVRRALGHAASIAVALAFLLPLFWMVAGSLRMPGLPPARTIEWLPDPLSPGNYARIFEILPLGHYAFNSLLVTSIGVPLTVLVASWAGFAMAQLPARSRGRLVVASIGLMMVPISALFLTRYVLFTWAGLVDSHAALIAPAVMGTSPLFVLLFYWTFRRVPAEIFESARLDGASALRTWGLIAMPLTVPTTVTVGVLAFLFYWSDFVSPLLYLKSEALYTLPVGLRQLQQLDPANWPLVMAGAVVMTAPSVLAFLAVQRFFHRTTQLIGTHGR